MSDPCPVCQGRRKVTLRLHQPMMKVSAFDAKTQVLVPPMLNAKEFPCPECSPPDADVASRMADAAIEEIHNWGSYGGDELISKAKAYDAVRRALEKVQGR